jgi:hypothetical protein
MSTEKNMKTKLQTTLSTIAPQIEISTHWEHDPDHKDIRRDCDGMDDEDPDDWQAWQSEIRASAVSLGEIQSGSAYLGGTWERAGDNPAESNPDISGYENGMTTEALRELRNTLGTECPLLIEQIDKAISYCEAEAQRSYDEQRAAMTNA